MAPLTPAVACMAILGVGKCGKELLLLALISTVSQDHLGGHRMLDSV